jgi:hypothetical protein
MAVLTSKERGFGPADPLKERRDSRMKKYIRREGVLKSWSSLLVI